MPGRPAWGVPCLPAKGHGANVGSMGAHRMSTSPHEVMAAALWLGEHPLRVGAGHKHCSRTVDLCKQGLPDHVWMVAQMARQWSSQRVQLWPAAAPSPPQAPHSPSSP